MHRDVSLETPGMAVSVIKKANRAGNQVWV
jgi:hypothetical protein